MISDFCVAVSPDHTHDVGVLQVIHRIMQYCDSGNFTLEVVVRTEVEGWRVLRRDLQDGRVYQVLRSTFDPEFDERALVDLTHLDRYLWSR